MGYPVCLWPDVAFGLLVRGLTFRQNVNKHCRDTVQSVMLFVMMKKGSSLFIMLVRFQFPHISCERKDCVGQTTRFLALEVRFQLTLSLLYLVLCTIMFASYFLRGWRCTMPHVSKFYPLRKSSIPQFKKYNVWGHVAHT